MEESSPLQLKPNSYVYENLVYMLENNVNKTNQKKYLKVKLHVEKNYLKVKAKSKSQYMQINIFKPNYNTTCYNRTL